MTRATVESLIRDELQLPEGFQLDGAIRPAQVPGWDSMAWLRLIEAIERSCESEMPLEIFDQVLSVQDFVEAVVQFTEAGRQA